jgi:hypothetical protein
MRRDSKETRAVRRRDCVIALVVLTALLTIAILGPAHMDGAALSGHDSDHCATCAAILVLGTAVVLLAELLLLALDRARGLRFLLPDLPVVTERGIRLASPRAPPFIA